MREYYRGGLDDITNYSSKGQFKKAVRLHGRQELAVLLTVCLLAGAAWAFLELAENVQEGSTRGFDEKILLSLRNPDDISDPIGPRWVEELGRDFTALGGIGIVASVSLAVVGYLLLENKHRIALLVLLSVGGGIILSLLLKVIFGRPRPELVPHGSYVFTSSFPSGHSMMSAVIYLTLATLLARVHKRLRVRLYLLLLATLLTVVVGISRIYTGVHWPTDVVAGWTAGAFWALLCWELARWLQLRGRIEQEGADPDCNINSK